MKKTVVSLLLLTVIATSSWATYEDDGFNHVTISAGGRTLHTPKEVKKDMLLGYVWYDQSQPKGQQLSFRVQQEDIQYTCPPVPEVAGLEEERDMGISPQIVPLFDGALVELVEPDKPVTAFGKTFPIAAGEYRTLLISKLPGNADLDGDMKKIKYKAQCQMSAVKAEIEFIETIYNFPSGLNLECPPYRDIPAAPQASDIYTVSCWYLAEPEARNDKVLPIFTAAYPATEAGLENQFKTFIFGIQNLKTKNSYGENLSHLTFTYPVLTPGEGRNIKVYKEVMVDEMKTKVIPKSKTTKKVEWSSLKKSELIEFYKSGKLPEGYHHEKMTASQQFHYFCRKRETGASKRILISGDLPQLSKTTVTSAKTVQKPTGQKVKEKKEIDSTEPTFLMETKDHCSSPVVSDNLMHLMFIVNAQAKTATAYCNDQELWEVACPELVSLKAAGKHTFGPHPAELAEVFVLDGLHQASEFGCFNCHNHWIPKKYAGQPGVNGYSPQAKKFNTLR